jgi:hypothetical protein
MTASSDYGGIYVCINGRLNNAAGSWLPSSFSDMWLQVDLLNTTYVKGVATQGRHDYNQFTQQYQLSYSDDGVAWTIYKEEGIVKVCLFFSQRRSNII